MEIFIILGLALLISIETLRKTHALRKILLLLSSSFFFSVWWIQKYGYQAEIELTGSTIWGSPPVVPILLIIAGVFIMLFLFDNSINNLFSKIKKQKNKKWPTT